MHLIRECYASIAWSMRGMIPRLHKLLASLFSSAFKPVFSPMNRNQVCPEKESVQTTQDLALSQAAS